WHDGLLPLCNLWYATIKVLSSPVGGRLIHENFKAVQLTAKLLHRKKIPSALYKIDIAKAFDSLDWTFLLQLLSHMGFSNRWTNWISVILSTASTKIILNGSPGRRICHARGLRLYGKGIRSPPCYSC